MKLKNLPENGFNQLLKLLYWLPTLIIMGLIFYFSSRTGSQSNAQSDPIAISLLDLFGLNLSFLHPVILLVRKFGHLFEFLLLGGSVIFAVENTIIVSQKYSVLISIVLSYLYALSDEIHQLFVPDRSGLFTDTLVDLIGILFGIIFYLVIIKIVRKKKS